MLKRNQGEVREAVLFALECEKGDDPPDVVTYDKGHGRLEVREYWWMPVDEELRHYLAEEYGRRDVRWCGRVRRTRQALYEDEARVEEVVWIYQARIDREVTPERLSRWVRCHWEIENRLFWVLDVTYGEDRSHARRIGPVLHLVRGAAVSLIRRRGFRYVPDGRRAAAARDDRGWAWLQEC